MSDAVEVVKIKQVVKKNKKQTIPEETLTSKMNDLNLNNEIKDTILPPPVIKIQKKTKQTTSKTSLPIEDPKEQLEKPNQVELKNEDDNEVKKETKIKKTKRQDQQNTEVFKKVKNNIEINYMAYMHLKLFIEDPTLKELYIEKVKNHNDKLTSPFIDAGFDLHCFAGKYIERESEETDYKYKLLSMDFGIKCSATFNNNCEDTINKTINTGFYIYPRSSLSLTPFRLANTTGIIDAGYRGNLKGIFDVLSSNEPQIPTIETRLVQICSPSLLPIYVEIVDTFEELGELTERNDGGFGSTGK